MTTVGKARGSGKLQPGGRFRQVRGWKMSAERQPGAQQVQHQPREDQRGRREAQAVELFAQENRGTAHAEDRHEQGEGRHDACRVLLQHRAPAAVGTADFKICLLQHLCF